MLRPCEKTKEHRHTSGAAYHVFRGSGRTAVGPELLQWEEGDCFVVPPWYPHKHENVSSAEDAILFSLNDSPLLEALGMLEWKRWIRQNEAYPNVIAGCHYSFPPFCEFL